MGTGGNPYHETGKKSVKTIDLKKLIYDFRICVENDSPVFYLKVCTGSTDNLKPETVLEAFYRFLGEEWNPLSIQIHRIDVYGIQNGSLVYLGENGDQIGE